MIVQEQFKILGYLLFSSCVFASLIAFVCFIFKKIRKHKRKSIALLFANKIDKLFMQTRKSVFDAWGKSGIERFLENGYLKPFMRKLAVSEGPRRNDYVAYGVMSEYLYNVLPVSLEFLTLLDFPGDLSIEKLLQKLKKRADDYTAAKIRVENEGFIQVESFFGPQKIFLKIEKGNIYFIFLEDLNYYISFECQEMLYRFLERKNEGKNIPRHVAGFYATICFLEKGKKFVVEFESGRAEESFRFACPIASFDEAFDKAMKKYSPEQKEQ